MKKSGFLSGTFILLSFILAGCDAIKSGNPPDDPKATDFIENRRSKASLARFQTPSKLEEYLKESIKRSTDNSSQGRYFLDTGVPETNGTATAADAGTGTQSATVFSTTNLQEAGVDEADLVKTDGDYLYIAVPDSYMYHSGWDIGISDVAPATNEAVGSGGTATDAVSPDTATTSTDSTNDTSTSTSTETSTSIIDDSAFINSYKNKIRVMKLSTATPGATETSVIPITDNSHGINDFYLVTGRANKPDLLAIIATGSNFDYGYWFNPWYGVNSTTSIDLVDVSDPASPANLKNISIDGQVISSRRIGETLYLVTRFTPSIDGYEMYPADDAQKNNNTALLEAATLSDLLPGYRIDGADAGPLTDAEDCYLPPTPNDEITTQTVITVTAINLALPDTPRSSCIIGQSETVYVSQTSLYLATTRYNYNVASTSVMLDASSGTSKSVEMVTYTEPMVYTDLHKFSLGNSLPSYCCSGIVDGHLGWEQDKKSFRMGEHNGYLRIVTSLGDTWNNTSTTRLTVLGESMESGISVLKEISRLPNTGRPGAIGKPGERLYSARFMGERGFLVTFKVTDPLYILDLSNPVDPYIAGELQIDGYSDYLHLVNENLLLGIGKDTVPDTSSSWGDGRGAWYQGVKLSLFDITNPENPTESDSYIIGKRGTSSDALMDHKAITYLPATEAKPARLAINILLHDTTPTYSEWFDANEPFAYYEWTHTGLYLFDLNPPTNLGKIDLKGKMIVKERSATETYDWLDGNSRAVIVNDSVHYVKGGRVRSGSWSADPAATSPQ
ncbi:MAG: beta-propeller domain-containing protein [Nitrospinota bacterium]|nr:beta-propeller domain-containing protein [Nitrospinota bacterium]